MIRFWICPFKTEMASFLVSRYKRQQKVFFFHTAYCIMYINAMTISVLRLNIFQIFLTFFLLQKKGLLLSHSHVVTGMDIFASVHRIIIL